MHTPLDIVRAWHDALNQGDLEKLVSLVHPDVVLGGPRSTTSGAQVVREWFGRSNVRLHPLAYFAREQRVVAEEEGEWIDPASGKVTGRQRVASAFSVEEGLITRIIRHDTLELALSDAVLTLSDRASLDL